MSATERQMLLAIQSVAGSEAGTNYALLSQKESSLQFEDLMKESNTTVLKVSSVNEIPGGADVVISDGFLSKSGFLDSPDKLEEFARNVLERLRLGGVLILREDLSGVANPRQQIPALTAFFDIYRIEGAEQAAGFEFYAVEQIDASIHLRRNWLDFFWIMRKKDFQKHTGEAVTFRDFLDKTQYTNTGIGAYEWMFGKNFISPGGYDENLRVLEHFGNLQPGMTMLDIGSGIGGGVRQAAAVFGIHVTGCDLSSNMLSEAIVRVHNEKDSRVKYTICDATSYSNRFRVKYTICDATSYSNRFRVKYTICDATSYSNRFRVKYTICDATSYSNRFRVKYTICDATSYSNRFRVKYTICDATSYSNRFRVKYTICDATSYKFPPGQFDLVFSRDCIQHIPNTRQLFANIMRSLRPGGTVLISMYGKGKGEWTEKFKSYVENRAYFLKNRQEIEQIAKEVGFVNVTTKNLTTTFKQILSEEKTRLIEEKSDFLQKFSEKEFNSLVNGWNDKLDYIEADNHNWNLFRAVKP